MFAMIGEALLGEFVGIGREKLGKLLEEEPLRAAWVSACKNVIDSYTSHALARGGSASAQPLTLDTQMEAFAQKFSLPSPQSIFDLLLQGWHERREALLAHERSDFFGAEEHEIIPVLTLIANRFFIEVAQIPRFRDPVLVLHALKEALPSQPSSDEAANQVESYVRMFEGQIAGRPLTRRSSKSIFPLSCSLVAETGQFRVEEQAQADRPYCSGTRAHFSPASRRVLLL